jgi:nitroimidazol reductase NimA-like FMN-containing flavoprotein (pyridoxamine 5'-phosphate oxidase superfamily)
VSPRIATNTSVSRDELLDFIRPRHSAIVMTTRSDGRPQASPVTCGVDAEDRIVISTYPERAKARNARRDPRVSVLILSDDFVDAWSRSMAPPKSSTCPSQSSPSSTTTAPSPASTPTGTNTARP